MIEPEANWPKHHADKIRDGIKRRRPHISGCADIQQNNAASHRQHDQLPQVIRNVGREISAEAVTDNRQSDENSNEF